MNGKVVVVTGTSSGFGRLTALELARRGHTVIATMRGVEGRNAQVRSELIEAAKAEGRVLQVLEMDVTDDASVASHRPTKPPARNDRIRTLSTPEC